MAATVSSTAAGTPTIVINDPVITPATPPAGAAAAAAAATPAPPTTTNPQPGTPRTPTPTPTPTAPKTTTSTVSTDKPGKQRPKPIPRLDTSSATTLGGGGAPNETFRRILGFNNNLLSSVAHKPFLRRRQSALTTPAIEAQCFLCEEQNPGDFTPTTKNLDVCLLCSRWFCPVHRKASANAYAGKTVTAIDAGAGAAGVAIIAARAQEQAQVCNINHATYFHSLLIKLKTVLREQQAELSAGGTTVAGRDLSEMLTSEGIFPSLGEREKLIFANSPVDERKQRELEQFRSLDAAFRNTTIGGGASDDGSCSCSCNIRGNNNGGVKGGANSSSSGQKIKGLVEEKEFLEADVAV